MSAVYLRFLATHIVFSLDQEANILQTAVHKTYHHRWLQDTIS